MRSRKKRGQRRQSKGRSNQQPSMSADRQKAAPRQEGSAATARPPEPIRSESVVSLDPLAPVIVRSGRPVNSHADADPARFPPPSTVAGCLRTAWARQTAKPFGPELARQLEVIGPLLLRGDGQVLVPKPADALYFAHGGADRCIRAAPRDFADGCGADMPDSLMPLQVEVAVEGKQRHGPAWWPLDDLLKFRRGDSISFGEVAKRGWDPMSLGDRRTHVSIDPETHAARGGGLFETEGLDFAARLEEDGASTDRLRLLARVKGGAISKSVVHLGGKRRMAALRAEHESVWPRFPDGWDRDMALAGGLCITLLTPGIFSGGYRPGWLGDDLTGSPPSAPGLNLRLCAAGVGRWQPHSGWDLARRAPRPARKVVPSGSTYWFRIVGDAASRDLRALWLSSACDLEQDRRDGFALALPCPWRPPDQARPANLITEGRHQ